jgi:hypothetical protein
MGRQVVQEPLEVGRIVLAVAIQEQVVVEVAPPQAGDAGAQGLPLAAALAGFQAQHFGAFGACDGARPVGGAVVHHQDAVQAVGAEPAQHAAEMVGLVMGGDESGNPWASRCSDQADLRPPRAARGKGCP